MKLPNKKSIENKRNIKAVKKFVETLKQINPYNTNFEQYVSLQSSVEKMQEVVSAMIGDFSSQIPSISSIDDLQNHLETLNSLIEASSFLLDKELEISKIINIYRTKDPKKNAYYQSQRPDICAEEEKIKRDMNNLPTKDLNTMKEEIMGSMNNNPQSKDSNTDKEKQPGEE